MHSMDMFQGGMGMGMGMGMPGMGMNMGEMGPGMMPGLPFPGAAAGLQRFWLLLHSPAVELVEEGQLHDSAFGCQHGL